MDSVQKAYLTIRADIFGTSTALYPIDFDPSASITLLDRTPFPYRLDASLDINKIVFSHYGNAFCAGLASEAQISSTDGYIYEPYYHENWISHC